MPRNVDLRQIEAFKAVVESGTVSRAALVLGMSQPQISKQIANMEMDTGLKLFDRFKGRLAPTANGLRLYEEVGRIFAGVLQVENAVEAIRREKQGRIAVGVMPALSGPFIERVTRTFLGSRQGVFCAVEQLTSDWIVERIVSRRFDVGLVNCKADSRYVTSEPLMTHPLVAIASPDHPFAAKDVIEPEDLHDTPFIAFDPMADIGTRVADMLERYRVEPRTVLATNVAPTVCELVASGLGVSLVHPLSLSGFEDRLIARRFEPEVPYWFQLCRLADSRNADLVTAFMEDTRAVAARISRDILAR
ncbi:LysR substrate-binding domain-containing protein [Sphingomonas crocodyli]|uniref:LysR family transcriptional regulator n=1 Tax=Sphingomonas crocodyli TaxID=1979270 RepID=A0A437M7B2_9SPHN|nr:LysR substrate-binding domain-containing protein [Sphingomonas crocodyli]RVT93493.1 LysR family transcriptional regulator [Sphingomonas crocodyli]